MTLAAEPFVRLSWSQISCYAQCPAKWWFSRNLPPERTPSPLHFGRAVHKALDLFYGARMEGGNVGLDELLEAFKASWNDQPEAPLQFAEKEDAGSLKAMAERMLAAFLETVQPGEVIAVEQPFAAEVAEGVLVTGAVDLVEVKAGRFWIVDNKTSKNSPSASFDKDQLALYLVGLQEAGLVPFVSDVGLRYDVLRKLKTKGEFATLEVEVSERGMDALRQKVSAIAKAVRGRIVWRNPSWACAGCQWARACSEADLESETAGGTEGCGGAQGARCAGAEEYGLFGGFP